MLFDVHISGRRVAPAVRQMGHDVRALDDKEEQAGLSDPAIMEIAVREGRVVVSANVRHFMPLVEEWAAQGRRHAGCILVPRSIRHQDFALIIAGIRAALAEIPDQQDWIDRVYWISKDASAT